MSFGALLRRLRLEADLSQTDLSNRSGIPKPTLSRYENDHVAPSLGTLRRLAEALGVTEAALLPHDPTPEELFADALRRHGIRPATAADAEQLADTVAKAIEEQRPRRVN